jgi:hypothetical protein
MRRIALQSAVGGMAASVIGMLLAVFGLLSPLAGAIAQEVIDVLAILNSARVVMAPRKLSDFDAIPSPSAPRVTPGSPDSGRQ